jgi:hypothetical protein
MSKNRTARKGYAMSELTELQATFAELSSTEATQAIQQLRWLLDGLPADGQTASDGRLRIDLELFLAGYEIGTHAASAEGSG